MACIGSSFLLSLDGLLRLSIGSCQLTYSNDGLVSKIHFSQLDEFSLFVRTGGNAPRLALQYVLVAPNNERLNLCLLWVITVVSLVT